MALQEGLYFPAPWKDERSIPLYIESSQYFHVADGREFDSSFWGKRPRPVVVIKYTLSGCGRLHYRGTDYDQKTGDCFHILTEYPHRYWLPVESESWEFISMTIRGPAALSLTRELINSVGPVSHWSGSPGLLRQITNLYQRIQSNIHHNPYLLGAVSYEIMMTLLAQTHRATHPQSLSAPMQKALAFINNNFARAITVEDVARHAQLSASHFAREFKACFGTTVRRTVEDLRMRQARHLLNDPELSLGEIAERCGFAESAYFNAVFSRANGISPGRYRKAAARGLI